MAMQTKLMMTVADYLAWEARQEFKHEYIDGEIYEMTGGSGDHSIIAANIMLSLGSQINRQNFTIYNSDIRVQISVNRYVYPDVSVVQDQAIYADVGKLRLLNPVFVVEVTSPSSHMRDRFDKREYYFAVPSIEAYLIIDQDRVRADLYTRSADGWLLQDFSSLDDVMPLPMLNCELPLAQIYRGLGI